MSDEPAAEIHVRIERVSSLAPADWELLLLADPSEKLVNQYVHRAACFRAVLDGTAVGIAVLLPVAGKSAELMNIAVSPGLHGRGVGKALLGHVLNHARREGFERLVVNTGNWPVDNLAFYQRLGFRIVAVEPDYFTRAYPEPIVEDGVCCRDRITLHCGLGEGS